MKKIILLSIFLVGTYAHAACPDFSGYYVSTFDPEDFRDQEFLTLKQTGCDKIDGTSDKTFKKDTLHFQHSFVWDITTSPNSDGKMYWDGDRLVSFQKNATSEHCDIRDFLTLEKDKNLVCRWRFECPSTSRYFPVTNGISPWYRDNIVHGTWYKK